MDLFNPDNFTFLKKNDNSYIKVLNLVALISILTGLVLSIKLKDPKYFGISIIVLSATILFKNTLSKFSEVQNAKVQNTKIQNIDVLTNAFDTGVKLQRPIIKKNGVYNNKLYVKHTLNLNKGDVIALESEGLPTETHIISDIVSTLETLEPVIIVLNEINGNFPLNTKILKVSDVTPNIITPPDANKSIRDSNPNNISVDEMELQGYPKYTLPDGSRYDWNLENSTLVAGEPSIYKHQGPPYGPLGRRSPTIQNPMGNIYPVEYDNTPTFYGTINSQDSTNGILNDKIMTESQEMSVSQRVQDLLFHKGNSQWHYTPQPVDTIPNDQEGFAHFCYRNPTNLVNPKYASIFVNDPEKFKLVSKLARATGTENGG
jgi:hypothetical protein